MSEAISNCPLLFATTFGWWYRARVVLLRRSRERLAGGVSPRYPIQDKTSPEGAKADWSSGPLSPLRGLAPMRASFRGLAPPANRSGPRSGPNNQQQVETTLDTKPVANHRMRPHPDHHLKVVANSSMKSTHVPSPKGDRLVAQGVSPGIAGTPPYPLSPGGATGRWTIASLPPLRGWVLRGTPGSQGLRPGLQFCRPLGGQIGKRHGPAGAGPCLPEGNQPSAISSSEK